MSREETISRLLAASGMVKITLGVMNTCSWLVTLDAHDVIRKSPRYRQQVKKAFKTVLDEHKAYENRLLYATVNRFFCVEDMTPETRKKFGADFTDQKYFEFWKGIGGPAYNSTRPLVTSLWNKYRKSLEEHGQKESVASAWAFTALAALRLADAKYESFINRCPEDFGLDTGIARNVFSQFSMKRVLDAWMKATEMFADTSDYPISEMEDRNISLGIEQLADAWLDPSILYDSTQDTIPDFDDIFRTKGEMKKAMREIAEYKAETV